MSSSQSNAKPTRVLVLGASGSVGGSVVRELGAYEGLDVVRATRKADQVESWRADGKSAVCIDLDDPRTFPQALKNVDRLFVMTGYTMNMVQQTKTIVDAAVDAGVCFVVHLGVFGNGKSTDPHYTWHELVERYIQGSGIAWCHLHPNFFMENLLSFMPVKDGSVSWPMGDGAAGWTAADDIAAVAAKVLAEGPETHAGEDYFLSTDVFDGPQLAEVLSASLGRRVTAQIIKPDELKKGCCQSNRYKSLFAVGWPSLDLRRDMLPLDHGSRPSDLVVVAADEVTFLVEVIVEGGMDGAKLLQRFHLSEPEHRPLPPPERLVRVLRPVIRIAANLLVVRDAKLLHRRPIGT